MYVAIETGRGLCAGRTVCDVHGRMKMRKKWTLYLYLPLPYHLFLPLHTHTHSHTHTHTHTHTTLNEFSLLAANAAVTMKMDVAEFWNIMLSACEAASHTAVLSAPPTPIATTPTQPSPVAAVPAPSESGPPASDQPSSDSPPSTPASL